RRRTGPTGGATRRDRRRRRLSGRLRFGAVVSRQQGALGGRIREALPQVADAAGRGQHLARRARRRHGSKVSAQAAQEAQQRPLMIESWREAAIVAPLGPRLHRRDTRVIERPGWYQLVTPSAPGTTLNEVILSDVSAKDAEQAIDEVIATYRATGHPVKWN